MKSDTRRLAELLLDASLNHSQAGRLANKHRDTVRKMRRRAAAAGLTENALPGASDDQLRRIILAPAENSARRLQPDWDAVVQHILTTGDSMQDYYDDYYLKQSNSTLDQPHMSYPNFARLLSKILKRRAPEYRHHYRPGEVMQIDFAGFQPIYINTGHERVKCTLLLAHFPFSQYCLGWVIHSQSRSDSIHGLIRIFESLNGTTKRIVLDNFKAAIDAARSKRKEARINPEFRAFLDHYQISPDPARGGEARDKGSVEGIVKLAQRYYQRTLRNSQPHSIAELNDLLQLALDHLNRKVMRRWKLSRADRFKAREAEQLRLLPQAPYAHGTWKPNIKVQRHYHVNVDGRDYSVPYRLIGEAVSIKATATTIEIHHDSSLVAVHTRQTVTPQDDSPVTDPAHMPGNHQAMWRQNPDTLIAQASSYSPNLGRFVTRHLDINGNPRATYNMLKRLLEVGSVHGKATIDAACVEAIRRNQINADTLRQILDRGPRKQTRKEPEPSPQPTDNIRGASYYAEDDSDAA